MAKVKVRPVQSKREHHIFFTFPWKIYQLDPLWVPPILSDRKKYLDPQHSPFLKRGGIAVPFIAWKDGEPVGTICAAEDPVINEKRERHDCVFGFFECIDDPDIAHALFDQAVSWARQHNLNALFGPYNLDYEDSYGILIEGRDRPPVVFCGHTPPYYQKLVESYGFQPARADGLAFAVDLSADNPMMDRIHRIADRIRSRRQFSVRSANLDDWDSEVERVYQVISRALVHLPGYIPWQREALENALAQFRKIVDPELILFGEAEGQVVGWFPGVPNINEALIHANGLRYPWDYLRLALTMRRKPACVAVKSVLVLPEYWDTGLSILLFDEMYKRVRARGYTWVDLSVTSEENPDTPLLAARAGAKIYKRYRVYRLQLN
jgi:GNAT superfamily N-acetyltransferase